jgi:hypothetical protein
MMWNKINIIKYFVCFIEVPNLSILLLYQKITLYTAILNVLATFSHEITSLDHVEFKLHQVFPDLYHSRVYTGFNVTTTKKCDDQSVTYKFSQTILVLLTNTAIAVSVKSKDTNRDDICPLLYDNMFKNSTVIWWVINRIFIPCFSSHLQYRN